jgi:hypothetical protein
MKDGGELAWLRLTDKSDLVLTSLYVLQHQDRGIFGESHAIIPRKAITGVRLSWRRSRGLIFLGTILVVICMILTIGLIIEGRAWVEALTFSPLAISFIQYGSLSGGLAVYVLFWFTKRNEIKIMAPTATLGGIPRSYEEADKFCALLVSELEDQPKATNKSESKPAIRMKTADHSGGYNALV